MDDGDKTLYLEHPDITASSNEVFVVWSDWRSGNWEIYCQKQDHAPSGTPGVKVNDFPISDPTNAWNSISPAIDAGPTDIHIAWQRFNPDSGAKGSWEIVYEKVPPGDPRSPNINDFEVTENDGYNSAKPDIAVDDDGCAHIVWMDSREHDPWSPPPAWRGTATPPEPHPYRWEIFTTLIDENGDFPWVGMGYSRDKRQSDMESIWWYGSYTGSALGDDHSMYPRIATHGGCCGDCQGTKDITWHDLRTSDWEVYHSTIANECNNPNSDQPVSPSPQDDIDMYPDKALDPRDNKPDITWQRQRAGRWEVLETPYNKGEYARVIIDELHAYDLAQVDPADTDATDGILYGWSTTLEGGPPPGIEHTYRFEAYADGQNATGDVGTHDGPIVIEVPVGGITQLFVDGSDAPASAAEGSGSSAPPYALLAGATAAAAAAIAAGGWYARRRWLA